MSDRSKRLPRWERWTLAIGVWAMAVVMLIFGALFFGGWMASPWPVAILSVAGVVVVVWVICLIVRDEGGRDA